MRFVICKEKNQRILFTRGRHRNNEVYCLSQRYFELPLLIRDNRNNVILFEQIAKTVQNYSIDKASFDMGYEEFKQPRNKAWNQKLSYLEILDVMMKKYCVFVLKAKRKREFLNL